jgi:thymidylate synthase
MSRLFKDFPEAQNEIKRDLAELSISVQPETMQDIYVADNPMFRTNELQNYMYTVLKPDYTEIDGVHEEWIQQEWLDRLAGDLNPGNAWKTRPEVWEPLMEKPNRVNGKLQGHFAYSYSQRMGGTHIRSIIEELKTHPNSRQLYLPVWDRVVDEDRRGKRRVPCSLGYWFVYRDNALHITYMMRSCDFVTHYGNDVALATAMMQYVAKEADLEPGTFTHFVGSLHVYAKDVEGVF